MKSPHAVTKSAISLCDMYVLVNSLAYGKDDTARYPPPIQATTDKISFVAPLAQPIMKDNKTITQINMSTAKKLIPSIQNEFTKKQHIYEFILPRMNCKSSF